MYLGAETALAAPQSLSLWVPPFAHPLHAGALEPQYYRQNAPPNRLLLEHWLAALDAARLSAKFLLVAGVKPTGDRTVLAVTLWNIAPGGTSTVQPKYAVDNAAMVMSRQPSVGFLRWQ